LVGFDFLDVVLHYNVWKFYDWFGFEEWEYSPN